MIQSKRAQPISYSDKNNDIETYRMHEAGRRRMKNVIETGPSQEAVRLARLESNHVGSINIARLLSVASCYEEIGNSKGYHNVPESKSGLDGQAQKRPRRISCGSSAIVRRKSEEKEGTSTSVLAKRRRLDRGGCPLKPWVKLNHPWLSILGPSELIGQQAVPLCKGTNVEPVALDASLMQDNRIPSALDFNAVFKSNLLHGLAQLALTCVVIPNTDFKPLTPMIPQVLYRTSNFTIGFSLTDRLLDQVLKRIRLRDVCILGSSIGLATTLSRTLST
ncbi:hypothetical protein PGT21_018266 [Puccinia graminis f. sp. tritici]|uniref:Uncharacterized protein n=1 Tax=Puccinia graminis f. sp. tritici TaxID=56615 RepID=A0A5B0QFU5_PUCGR|nr:hypothetical protein PGT21_018266 [Puccinia graminis f. sp. tritici]